MVVGSLKAATFHGTTVQSPDRCDRHDGTPRSMSSPDRALPLAALRVRTNADSDRAVPTDSPAEPEAKRTYIQPSSSELDYNRRR
jgi:hypothetical protein